MNDQREVMEEEQVHSSYPPYTSSTAPDSTFDRAPDTTFDQFPYAGSTWATPPTSYYQVPAEPARDVQGLSIFERRGVSTTSLNVSCPEPMAVSASHYHVPPTTFHTPMWSPDISSGLAGMESPLEYFSSPLGTGTLSFVGSTSASPVATGWPVNLTPIHTGNMGSSGSFSVADNYGPGLDDSNVYSEESFDALLHMPASVDATYNDQSPETDMAEVSEQPHPHEGAGVSSGGGRKSSLASDKSSSASSKTTRKRKMGSSQETQRPPPAQGPKLRTAARRQGSETGHLAKPGESPEDQRARTSHNKVEKEYRNRLNKEFAMVIDVLPASQAVRGQSSKGRMSKADVIGNATMTIQSLADEVVQLREKKRLMEEEKNKNKNKKPVKDVQPS